MTGLGALWRDWKLHSGAIFFLDRLAELRGRGARNRKADDLLAWAAGVTGLDDYGDPLFVEGYRVLHQAFKETKLSHQGLVLMEIALAALLKNRLLLEQCRARHPEYIDLTVKDPIFILGMPRTGSTLLHRLLDFSPSAETLKFWQLCFPCPPPGLFPDTVSERRRATRSWTDYVHRRNPTLSAIHYTEADSPEECHFLLRNCFGVRSFEMMAPIHAYIEWLEQRPATPFYEDFKFQLQLLQLGTVSKRLILKSPFHIHELDTLMRVFPDACLIRTERHPPDVVSSNFSLWSTVRKIYGADDVDRDWTLDRIDTYAGFRRAFQSWEERLPASRCMTVEYGDFVQDPMKIVREICSTMRLEWSQDSETQARDWMKANPAGCHGTHRHGLEATGVDRDEVLERLLV